MAGEGGQGRRRQGQAPLATFATAPLLGVCPGMPVSYCSPVLSHNSGPGDFEDDHIRFLQFSARKQDLINPRKGCEGSKSDSSYSCVLPDISLDLSLQLPEN